MENKQKSTFRKLVFKFDAHDYEEDMRNDAPSAPSARQRLTSTPKKKSGSVSPLVELLDLEESSEDVFQESCNLSPIKSGRKMDDTDSLQNKSYE